MKPLRFLFPLLLALTFVVPPAAGAPLKYSLSVFHFNIQYVIGGLYGFIPLPVDYPLWEIGPDQVEDMIVRESFKPILDLLDNHPDWTLTLELQGYFIEVLAARHPNVLNQLRDLVDSGGVELVSFHYADQLFIAYPYEDWQRSNERTREVMEEYDLTLSGAVFCQEGQGAEAMAQRMEENGYDVMAWPKNLWGWQHGDFEAAPYYDFGNIKMVVAGKGVTDDANEVYVDWNFMGDGELLATGEFDPYFPWFFHYREDSVEEYEAELQALVDDGYLISSIGQYVADLEEAGIEPADPPPLMDGTWQPSSTMGVSMWLGRGGLWRMDERDNHVRSWAYLAHREIKAAETAAEAAGLDRAAVLDEAWRRLHDAEVSDGSGINPYRGEVEFCIASAAEATRIARDVIDEAKETLGMDAVVIDTAAGEVTEGTIEDAAASLDEGPVPVTVAAKKRDFQTQWFQVSENPPTYRLEITFGKGSDLTARQASVDFPLTGDQILTTGALKDDEIVAYNWDDFDFEYWYLPTPIGLVGLGDNWWVVKDTAQVHIAGYIEPGWPYIRFEDLTPPWFETITWVFYLVQGSGEDALALADHLNVHPTLAR